MKTFLLTIITTIILMSFYTDNKVVWHYPFFVITYDQKVPDEALTCFEGYKNGVAIDGQVINYLIGIDSVAVKYRLVSNNGPVDYYTNFYARAGDRKWKKYDSNKVFVKMLTEYRRDTAYLDDRFPKGIVVYYPVK